MSWKPSFVGRIRSEELQGDVGDVFCIVLAVDEKEN